tara:strand:+ start:38228 stop:38491 length:264 start_codon:yes stop_codon:yes gene_type:complete
MALKQLHQVQVTITKDLSTGQLTANCQAIATLPEIENTRFGVNLPVEGDGVTSLINNAIEALKTKMAEGGHTVEDAPSFEAEATEAE